MVDIINFHDNPVHNIKKELVKKEEELARANNELVFFKHIYSATTSVSELLKLQVADIRSNLVLLEGHLKLVNENLVNIQTKLDNVDKMKGRIVSEPPNKDK